MTHWQLENNIYIKLILSLFCLILIFCISALVMFFPFSKILTILFVIVVFALTYKKIRWGSLILILVLPTIYLYKYTGWSNATITDLTILTIMLAWFLSFFKQKSIQLIRTKLDLPLLLFLVLSFIAMIHFLSNIPNIDFVNINNLTNSLYSFRILLTTIEAIFTFYFIVNTVKSKQHINLIIIFSMISLTVVCLIAVWQYVSTFSVFEYSIFRVSSTFGGDCNAFGMYLVLFLPIVFFSFFYSHNIFQKILFGIISILAIISLFVSYSRGGWLGITAGMIFFFIIARKIIVELIRKYIYVFVAFLILALIIFHPLILYENKVAQRIRTWEGQYQGRQELWKNALKIWSKYPFFGAGIGNIPKEYISLFEFEKIKYIYQMDFVPGVNGRALKLSINDSYVSIKQFLRLEDVKNYTISFYYILEGDSSSGFNMQDIHNGKTLFSKKLNNTNSSRNWTFLNSSFQIKYPTTIQLRIYTRGSGILIIDEVNLEGIKNPGFEQGINQWEIRMIETASFVTHNIYLNILAERGIFAFIVFIWILVVIFSSQFYLKRENDYFVKFLSFALLASVFGLLVHGLVDNTLFFNNRITMLFWIIVGLLFTAKKSI